MNPTEAYVWVWLPGAAEPVVAGRLTDQGPVVTFTYGRSYLERSDAIALYLPEFPLRRGEITPISGEIAGCIADAGPDAWGRRVIEHQRIPESADLATLGYLLASGSNRLGALDFQQSATEYIPQGHEQVPLGELAEVANRIENGVPLTPELERALFHGSSMGGARPKAVLVDGTQQMIAKFTSVTDSYPVVKAEFVAMELARRAGLNVARVGFDTVLGRDVLLVNRFDRTVGGDRKMVVSALTILELHDADGIAGRYATYPDLAFHIRSRFTDPDATLEELFARIAFNILVGNTDDHARNHAAFWDGAQLNLTPAYDICPQNRVGEEAAQAMAYGDDGDRLSQVARCVAHSSIYHLTVAQAREIVDRQIAVITEEWSSVCDQAELSTADRDRLWGRQFLNPFALYGY
ncbi:MAG: type II toxin-antitoxin system HipA family toxin [bacterium]|nr:type II toxin-antitoxin system HipA family toxin [bacterium]